MFERTIRVAVTDDIVDPVNCFSLFSSSDMLLKLQINQLFSLLGTHP